MTEDGKNLTRLNEQLEGAKAKLEQLNHFKNHLLSLASHDMKAPLGTIKGYATILRQGLYGEVNDKVKETLARIEFAVDDLVNMVDNILDLRKIEEGRIEYKFARLDFVQLTREVLENLKPIADAKKLEMSFVAPEKEVFVSGDREYLKHVVQNLIENAVKYTPKGFIKTSLKETEARVLLSVEDSGMGVKPGTTPLIFEEFVRDERVKADIKGAGLGLHIAKSIVEAHGGKIWAESPGESRGSTFFVELTKAP